MQQQVPMQQQAPQQMYQQMPMQPPPAQLSYGNANLGGYGGYGTAGPAVAPHRIETKGWTKEKPVSSVILTVFSESSYDGLFREVKQEPPEPSVAVSLFQLSYADLGTLHLAMTGASIDGSNHAVVIREICHDISRAEPHSVVMNFECCSCASESGFRGGAADVMKMVRLFVDRQHMVMFGDFTVKALIKDWDTKLLGPNPFSQIGTCSNSFDLHFDCDVLRKSPSAQLATVANLCANGSAHVHALGGTVLFTVNPAATDNNQYKLEVLTVAVKVDQLPVVIPSNVRACTLPSDKDIKGAAGHVLLRYPSPKAEGQEGFILVSMGHWIELARLDVKLENVIRHAEINYGTEYANNLSAQLRCAAPAAQAAQIQSYAKMQVQQASPAMYGNSAAYVQQQQQFQSFSKN